MFGDGIEQKDHIHSFLMIGQSNMAGRGDFGEVAPIVNNNCYMLRMGRWQPMSEPINPDRGIFDGRFRSGVGLAASFADELAKYSGWEIGLIPCADGGTKIEQWQPGGALYDHAVMTAQLAMRTSRLCGILWHQGESNCRDLDVEEYRRLFLNMANSLRKDLHRENLPFIIGELSEQLDSVWGMKDTPVMNRLLHSLQQELPLCAIVQAKELPLKEDGLHFTASSCRELGKRYFEKYKALTEKALPD